MSLTERSWRWCNRRKFVVSSLAIVMGLVVVGISLLARERQTSFASEQLASASVVDSLIRAESANLRTAISDVRNNVGAQLEIERRLADHTALPKRHCVRMQVALLPQKPAFALDVIAFMLTHADAHEFTFLRDELLAHAEGVVEQVLRQEIELQPPGRQTLQLLLVMLEPPADKRASSQLAHELAERFANFQPHENTEDWIQAAGSVRNELAIALQYLCRDPNRSNDVRTAACRALIAVYNDKPESLVAQVPFATDQQHRLLCDAMLPQTARGAGVAQLSRCTLATYLQ